MRRRRQRARVRAATALASLRARIAYLVPTAASPRREGKQVKAAGEEKAQWARRRETQDDRECVVGVRTHYLLDEGRKGRDRECVKCKE